EVPVLAERLVELADLVALRQVGIEVVLPREAAGHAQAAAEGERGADGHADRVAVEDRERAGQAEAHRAHVRVGRRAEFGRATAEDLGPREELRVDLQPDDRLVAARHGEAAVYHELVHRAPDVARWRGTRISMDSPFSPAFWERALPIGILGVALVGVPILVLSPEGLPRMRALQHELADVNAENTDLKRDVEH